MIIETDDYKINFSKSGEIESIEIFESGFDSWLTDIAKAKADRLVENWVLDNPPENDGAA